MLRRFIPCIAGFLLPTILLQAQKVADTIKTNQLDEVVVTGQYKAQSLKNSVYQLKVINAERIKASGATTIQQVLNTQLGFRFSNDAALGTTDVQLNGMNGRNVKILIDGVPMIDRFDQRVSLSQVDINTIERIEIVEGPMSVSYGTDAMAGVINIITKKALKNNLSVSAKVQEETAGTEYYPFSFQGVHHQNVNLAYKKNKISVQAGGTHNDFSGFGGDAWGRGKSWLPKEQYFGNARVGYTTLRLNAYYRIDGLHEEITARNSINFNNYKALDQRFGSKRFTHQLQADYAVSNKVRYNGLLSISNYQRQTKTVIHDFSTQTETPGTADGQQDLSKLAGFTFRNTFQYQLNDKVSFQPGIDINHEKMSGARVSGSPQINDYALFISSEIKATKRINIRPGLRFIKNSVYDAPPVVPSINTKFSITKNLDARLNYGYGFRAPSLRELYFTFVDANHNLIGNPDLKAENSNSFNGSLSWSPQFAKKLNYTATINGFYNAFKNQIDLAVSPTNSTQYTYVNISSSNTAGAGLENRFLLKNLDASIGFLYTAYAADIDATGYVKEDNRNYLWTPEANANIIYNIQKIKTKLGLFYKYIGEKPQFGYSTQNGQPTIVLMQTSAYNLADVTATTQVFKFLSVAVGVKNLFDVTRINSNAVSGTHSSGGPQSISYGRSYFMGLNFQL